jgi:hypothetical protein
VNDDLWFGFRVVQFEKGAVCPADPTSLAPWRTWFLGHLRVCQDAERFRAELAEAPGAVLALVHLTDLPAIAGDLQAWLDGDPLPEVQRPQLALFVYSGSWTGPCDYSAQVIPQLPARYFPQRWITVSPNELLGNANPAAWWGHTCQLIYSLAQLMERFTTWRREAGSALLQAPRGYPSIRYEAGEPEDLFLEQLVNSLRRGLLTHNLNSDEAHPRRHDVRFRNLLENADRLWLLQGIARSLYWDRAEALTAGVLGSLRELLQRENNLDDQVDPSRRERWQDIIQAIQRQIDAAQHP